MSFRRSLLGAAKAAYALVYYIVYYTLRDFLREEETSADCLAIATKGELKGCRLK